jgi:hypothetical protein
LVGLCTTSLAELGRRCRLAGGTCYRTGVAAVTRGWRLVVAVASLCLSWFAILARLLAYSVIIVVGSGILVAKQVVPLVSRLASICTFWFTGLAGLLAYSVILVVSSGVYSVRVIWADRVAFVRPFAGVRRHRPFSASPLRRTRMGAGTLAASLVPNRRVVAAYVGIALLAFLLGWLVAHSLNWLVAARP